LTDTVRSVVTSPGQTARPTRRARSDEAILKAARELLDERGVHGLTIEGVADRSGVAKTTIYRRYRGRNDLALAVLVNMTAGFRAPADLGDTRKELLAFVNEATQVILRGGVIEGLVSEIAADPRLAETYRERIIKVRYGEVRTIIDRGIERGDLRPDTDLRVLHEILIGPLFYRLLLSGYPLNKKHAGQLVDAAMAAYAPLALRRTVRTRSNAR
jgi:AcrR family transcriptional regulator